jgi:hypothetical protein
MAAGSSTAFSCSVRSLPASAGCSSSWSAPRPVAERSLWVRVHVDADDERRARRRVLDLLEGVAEDELDVRVGDEVAVPLAVTVVAILRPDEHDPLRLVDRC